MAVIIRDQHLELTIDAERQRRQDSTMAKTLSDLARERLIQIAGEQRSPSPAIVTPQPEPQPA